MCSEGGDSLGVIWRGAVPDQQSSLGTSGRALAECRDERGAVVLTAARAHQRDELADGNVKDAMRWRHERGTTPGWSEVSTARLFRPISTPA